MFDIRSSMIKQGPPIFEKDMNGRGRTFLPGLAMLAWYAQALGLAEGEQLRKEFEERTLIPLSQYIATFDPATPP
jgi:hypothetical protein